MFDELNSGEDLSHNDKLIVHGELAFDERFVDDEYFPEEDYEEITSEEVDRVVAALENLIDAVESENIKAYLQVASNDIFYLIYNDDEAQSEAA